MTFNLATILHESARATPGAAAMHLGAQTTSYAELDDASGRFARGLLGAGLAPGDVVAVHLPNLPQFLVAYFGALKAGMTVLPLNPLLKAPEIAYHLGDSGARLLVTLDALLPEAAGPARDVGAGVYVVSVTPNPLPEGLHAFDELIGAEPLTNTGGDLHPTSESDTAVLIYTSGTTGKPKGAELTHFQLYMNCSVAGSLFGARSDDVTLAVLPFFHVFGLSSVINVGMRFGAALAIVPRFEPAAVLDALERCTVLAGVPTMLQALAEADTSSRDLTRLRIAVSGGASLPEDVMRTFEQKFGIVVLEGYGLSETASTTSFNVSADERKPLSIGKPIWGVQMRVSDAEDQPLPPGPDHIGEILIRGHNVMKAYLNRPEATAETLRGGWLHTGDLGYVDADGFYFIVDRSKDLVIRGGYNVYPREIEEVLFAHPEVLEVAVIGKPDDRLGEEVVAVVVARAGTSPSEADLIAYCKERVAAYKYPREIRFVDALPKGPTGKVLKAELRDVRAAVPQPSGQA